MTIIIFVAIAVGVYLSYNAIVVGQNPISIEDIQVTATVIYDRNGEVFEVIGNGNAKNTAKEFPTNLKNAVVAVEDKRFYEHGGVDVIRTSKAILDTLTNGSFGAGGSTITQQLIKNVTGDNEVSISRKVREAFYAMQLEESCSKEVILTKYLNIIYLGKGNFGMVDACAAYFGKTPEELSLAEAAFMAAIIKSPETYVNDMERANERKNLVLGYMLEQQMISNSEYEEACSSFIEIDANTSTSSGANIYSWFSESVLYDFANMLAKTYDISYSEALSRAISGGYKIYSTVDPDLQSEVYDLGRNMSGDIGSVQSATLVMNKNGEVVACSGAAGTKRENFGFNRAVQARRQPGSAIKPLAVYGPALEENRISTMSVYTDQEISYGEWTPRNFYRDYYGDMTIRNALAMSNNTIPVQILYEMGPSTGISYLKDMGFKTESEDNALTLAVGAVSKGYTLPEMASGYQTILNGGTWCEPVFFTKIEAQSGTVIYNSNMQETEKVFSEDTSYILTDMLMSVVESEEGTAKSVAIDGMQVAAKTGTTSNNRDKWCCAYNPEYVVVTWCGYDKGSSEVEISSSYIQKHVRKVLKATATSQYSFDIPSTAQYVEICTATGMLANENCESTYQEIIKTSMAIDTCSCEGTVIDMAEDWWNENYNNFDIFNIFGNEESTVISEEEYPEEEYTDFYYEEEIPSDEVIIPEEGYYDEVY